MANTQLIELFVLHSKATIWLYYFFRKHEETECKRWMISKDIRPHGGRWYWHEFKKPQTALNWEGKISGKGWARFSSSWECHCYTNAVSYNRKVTFFSYRRPTLGNWFMLILVGGWNTDEGTSQPFFSGDHRRSTKKIHYTENESEC